MHNLALVQILPATLSRVSREIPLAKFSTITLLNAFTTGTNSLLVCDGKVNNVIPAEAELILCQMNGSEQSKS